MDGWFQLRACRAQDKVISINFHSSVAFPERADLLPVFHRGSKLGAEKFQEHPAMKTTPLIATAVLTAASVTAIALAGPTLSFAANADSNAAQACASSLMQRLTTNLEESGFTNVKVMPAAFSVQADDKSGNPVKMFITPNSIAEVTTSYK